MDKTFHSNSVGLGVKMKRPGASEPSDTTHQPWELEGLEKMVMKWYTEKEFPVVAVTMINGKFYSAGSREFINFHEAPAIQREFLNSLRESDSLKYKVAICNEQPEKLVIEVTDLRNKEQSLVNFVNDKYIPEDAESENHLRDEMRHYLRQIVTEGGTRKPRWGQERFKPVWWPESVPWSDPNNKKSRLTKPEIGLCISSWREHRMQITSQLNPIPVSQEERLHSSNDRIDDLSPNSILPLLCAYDQLDDVKLLTELLRRGDCRVADNLLKIMFSSPTDLYFQQTCMMIWQDTWEDNRPSLLVDKVSETTAEIECWKRAYVPLSLLQASYEPVKVSRDGNSFYEAISLALYGTTDRSSVLKMFSIAYLSLHQSCFLERVLNVFEKSNWKSPTEIGIEEPDLPPLIRAMCMESPKTSLFSVFALKGLNICSMEVYVPDNRNPLYLCGDAGPTVKVMKMKSSPKTKATEHFVPLIQTNAGFNTFVCKEQRKCGAVQCCVAEEYVEIPWAQCPSCLIFFHLQCLTYHSKLPTNWNCGCFLNVLLFNHLSEQVLLNTRRLGNILRQEADKLKRLLDKLHRGDITSKLVKHHRNVQTTHLKEHISLVLNFTKEAIKESEKLPLSYLVALSQESLVFITLNHIFKGEAGRFKIEELLSQFGYLL